MLSLYSRMYNQIIVIHSTPIVTYVEKSKKKKLFDMLDFLVAILEVSMKHVAGSQPNELMKHVTTW